MFENEIQNYLKQHGFEVFAPKAVLFDMDGVLYNSMPNHVIAWQEAMASFGIAMSKEQVYATEGMKGADTISMLVKQQKGQDITAQEAQKMYDEKGRLFHQMPVSPIFDGVFDLMEQIKKEGLKIGVVTGSAQKPLIERVANDFRNFIDKKNIVTAYSVKRGKPAPDPYLKGLQLTGNYMPYEGIVVENAPMGVRSGVAAQIFTIAINSGPLQDNLLMQEGANMLYHQISELSSAWKDIIANTSH